MPSLTCFNVRFTTNWTMLVLAFLFIALFTCLGFWQIQRAEEKRSMLAAEAVLAQQKPVSLAIEKAIPRQYQRVLVQGHYLSHVFLLDNRHYQHQFGYDVLSPLQRANGDVVMIDRGWIQGDNARQTFPKVQIPSGMVSLEGSVYYPSKKEWMLGPDSEEKNEQLMIVERIDANLLSKVLQKKVYPFIIRLDKQDAYGFVREWEIISMPPQRHIAYALQWFAMALVLLIIFIALNLKKKDEKKII